ncbi:MAG TPA: GH25 family lysozyme [Flavobacterium sp.]|nr:GH25 family lysozyme [Flavobacterium sp.]
MKQITIPVLLVFVLFSCKSPVENEHATDTVKTDNVKTDTVSSVKVVTDGPPRLYGIDISAWQGDEADFLNKKKDTLSFVICRATLGITVQDADFKSNWALIKKEGFIRGAYHFYYCSDDPTAQAKNFFSMVDSIAPGDLPPIVDIEDAGLNGVTNVAKIQKDLLTFLGLLESHYGRTPMIYVGPYFGNQYLNDPVFAKYPLWVADYDGESKPQIPTIWNSAGWKFWQRTDNVTVNGNVNDFDVFQGNQQAMQAFLAQ